MGKNQGITTTVPPVEPITGQVADNRAVSWGVARVLMGVMIGFIIGAGASCFINLPDSSSPNYAWSLLSLLSILIWGLVSAGIVHNGRRMRIVAWVGTLVEIVLVVLVNYLQLYFPGAQAVKLLANWGVNYLCLAVLLPVFCLIWLTYSSPRLRKI